MDEKKSQPPSLPAKIKLPPRHYIKHGAIYYLDAKNVWNWLGRVDSLAMQHRFGKYLNGSPLARPRREESYPQMMRAIFRQARKNAKTRGIAYRLSPDQEHSLILRANGRCEITGLEFTTETVPGSRRRPFIASLDRIEARAPYSLRNCRVVCCIVNAALSDWGEGPLLKLATGLTARAAASAP